MPKIHFERSHDLEADETRQRMEALMERFADKYGCTTRWVAPDHAEVGGRGMKGALELTPGKVLLNLNLPLLLAPLKGKIEQGIAARVSEALR